MAQSTLQGHVLAGEERFTLEWHQNDDSVWCALLPACACPAASQLLDHSV